MAKSDSKQASKQPYDEKERLQLIISALNTGLVLIDPDMTVVWANDLIKKWFSDPNLHGKKCFARGEDFNRTLRESDSKNSVKTGAPSGIPDWNEQPGNITRCFSLVKLGGSYIGPVTWVFEREAIFRIY